MSLPEKIRVFVLKGLNGRIYAIRHEAGQAVIAKTQLAALGVEADIEDHVSSRGFNSEGEIAVRCFPCHSHHLISVESVDGRSELYDGCCDAASSRRKLFEALNDRLLGIGMCDHDFEDVEVEHDAVDQLEKAPAGYSRYKSVPFEVVTERCRLCGQTRVVERDCACEPAIPCRCVGPCRC